MSKYPARPS